MVEPIKFGVNGPENRIVKANLGGWHTEDIFLIKGPKYCSDSYLVFGFLSGMPVVSPAQGGTVEQQAEYALIAIRTYFSFTDHRVTATRSGNVITIQAAEAGTIGNSYTLSGTGGFSVSGATLSGGGDEAPPDPATIASGTVTIGFLAYGDCLRICGQPFYANNPSTAGIATFTNLRIYHISGTMFDLPVNYGGEHTVVAIDMLEGLDTIIVTLGKNAYYPTVRYEELIHRVYGLNVAALGETPPRSVWEEKVGSTEDLLGGLAKSAFLLNGGLEAYLAVLHSGIAYATVGPMDEGTGLRNYLSVRYLNSAGAWVVLLSSNTSFGSESISPSLDYYTGLADAQNAVAAKIAYMYPTGVGVGGYELHRYLWSAGALVLADTQNTGGTSAYDFDTGVAVGLVDMKQSTDGNSVIFISSFVQTPVDGEKFRSVVYKRASKDDAWVRIVLPYLPPEGVSHLYSKFLDIFGNTASVAEASGGSILYSLSLTTAAVVSTSLIGYPLAGTLLLSVVDNVVRPKYVLTTGTGVYPTADPALDALKYPITLHGRDADGSWFVAFSVPDVLLGTAWPAYSAPRIVCDFIYRNGVLLFHGYELVSQSGVYPNTVSRYRAYIIFAEELVDGTFSIVTTVYSTPEVVQDIKAAQHDISRSVYGDITNTHVLLSYQNNAGIFQEVWCKGAGGIWGEAFTITLDSAYIFFTPLNHAAPVPGISPTVGAAAFLPKDNTVITGEGMFINDLALHDVYIYSNLMRDAYGETPWVAVNTLPYRINLDGSLQIACEATPDGTILVHTTYAATVAPPFSPPYDSTYTATKDKRVTHVWRIQEDPENGSRSWVKDATPIIRYSHKALGSFSPSGGFEPSAVPEGVLAQDHIYSKVYNEEYPIFYSWYEEAVDAEGAGTGRVDREHKGALWKFKYSQNCKQGGFLGGYQELGAFSYFSAYGKLRR